MNKREIGAEYERKAADYLTANGVKVIAFNFSSRQGEVDIIGIHKAELVFVEVKYRKQNSLTLPEEAVGRKKQEKICRTSDYFRIRFPQYGNKQVRYDVIAIYGEEIKWYQNAFPYVEYRGGGSDYRW